MDSIHKWLSVIFFYYNFASLGFVCGEYDISSINLPESQLPFYFNSFPKVTEQCLSNRSCIYRTLLSSDDYNNRKCWGYEPHCSMENAFSTPECSKDKPIWIKTFEEYLKTFYYQADFGKFPQLKVKVKTNY